MNRNVSSRKGCDTWVGTFELGSGSPNFSSLWLCYLPSARRESLPGGDLPGSVCTEPQGKRETDRPTPRKADAEGKSSNSDRGDPLSPPDRLSGQGGIRLAYLHHPKEIHGSENRISLRTYFNGETGAGPVCLAEAAP